MIKLGDVTQAPNRPAMAALGLPVERQTPGAALRRLGHARQVKAADWRLCSPSSRRRSKPHEAKGLTGTVKASRPIRAAIASAVERRRGWSRVGWRPGGGSGGPGLAGVAGGRQGVMQGVGRGAGTAGDRRSHARAGAPVGHVRGDHRRDWDLFRKAAQARDC